MTTTETRERRYVCTVHLTMSSGETTSVRQFGTTGATKAEAREKAQRMARRLWPMTSVEVGGLVAVHEPAAWSEASIEASKREIRVALKVGKRKQRAKRVDAGKRERAIAKVKVEA